MSGSALSKEEVERARRAASNLSHMQEGLLPHAIIDDMIGLEAYRRFMRCPDTEKLAAFAEDALPFEEALEVAAHEQDCPVCAADVADLRQTVRQQVGQLLASAPQWTAPFVGREALRRSLTSTLSSGDRPLVTLTAPPGTGKTRLTLETALEEAYLFPDGIWYIPATASRTEPLAAAEIARVVDNPGRPLPSSTAPLKRLQSFFADRRALLVLDDVGSASPTASVIEQLTASAPDLCCLVTARQPLGIRGEQAIVLPPMQTPRSIGDPHTLLASESLQLFTAYVQELQPDYRFDEREMVAAAAICERAAGLPLSIELAAARIPAMSPQEMLRQLDAGNVPPDDPAESLNALLLWSYGLLSRYEQMFLQQLGVFTDSFLIEQAAEICQTEEAFDFVERLHQHALLQRLQVSGQMRYRLSEPIRRFARDRLGTHLEEISRHHAAYFLRSAREQADLLEGKRQVEAMRQLEDDLPNLRAAMDWSVSVGEWRSVGQFGLSLNRFLMFNGCWQECSERLHAAVDAFERAEAQERYHQAQLALARCLMFTQSFAEAESLLQEVQAGLAWQEVAPELAEAYRGMGNVAQLQGRYNEAIARFEEALKQFEKLEDRRGIADCRQNLGWLAWQLNDYEHAERYLKGCLPVQRERGDRYRIADTLAVLGNVMFKQGRLEEARQHFEEALQLRRELGDVRGIASSINNMGMLWRALGDYRRADYCYTLAARQLEILGDRRTLSQVLTLQGDLSMAQGDLATARTRFETSCRMLEAVGDVHYLVRARIGLGLVAQREGALDEAARYYRDSLSVLDRLEDKSEAGLALYRLADLIRLQGDMERAYLLLSVALAHRPSNHRLEYAEIEAAQQQWEQQLSEEQILSLREQAAALPIAAAIQNAIEN